jgi:23S rRNA pseudouridine2605 synthase
MDCGDFLSGLTGRNNFCIGRSCNATWKRGSSLTTEQLEAARSERMRQNGIGAITLEDARTWLEETGLCLFLPKRPYSASLAPSFVEAVAGQRNTTPDPAQIALAEELLVRLEKDGIAVRLNLLGHPGEQPDYVVAAWVLPYVYALRGDRDWRRTPQLTGSRQVSPLAIQAYKRLEQGDATIAELTRFLGREVSESAVLRAITELWQQLRIIPVIDAPGQAAKWQLLRQRFQKAIAEGASTSQVTAISVLASIYLQAVIAATMEEVELFLAPLTARSKIREVLRGLVATRQVHTLTMGHAPHYYVAGTLPEFAPAPTVYASASITASSYLSRFSEYEDSIPEPVAPEPVVHLGSAGSRFDSNHFAAESSSNGAESHANGASNGHKAEASAKPASSRTHFNRAAAHGRNRKPSQAAASARQPRRTAESRPSRSGGSNNHAANGTRAAKPSWSNRNSSSKPASSGRSGTLSRTAARKDSRTEARSRTPALTAGAKAGNSKRYGFTARPKHGTNKRG